MKLAERGVNTNVHYKPLPMMTAYREMGWDIKDFPNAYDYYANLITLPLHTRLSDEEVLAIGGDSFLSVKHRACRVCLD